MLVWNHAVSHGNRYKSPALRYDFYTHYTFCTYYNQSAAGSVVFTACIRIMQPLFEVMTYKWNTAKLLPCKLLYQHTTRLLRLFHFLATV